MNAIFSIEPKWLHGDLQCCKDLRIGSATDGTPKWDFPCYDGRRSHEAHNQIWHDSKV